MMRKLRSSSTRVWLKNKRARRVPLDRRVRRFELENRTAKKKDIVIRLRSQLSELQGDEYWHEIYLQRKEAADEIDRLRLEVQGAIQVSRTTEAQR